MCSRGKHNKGAIQLFKQSETCQVVAFATNVTIQFNPSVSIFPVSPYIKCSVTAKGQIQEEHRPFRQSVLLVKSAKVPPERFLTEMNMTGIKVEDGRNKEKRNQSVNNLSAFIIHVMHVINEIPQALGKEVSEDMDAEDLWKNSSSCSQVTQVTPVLKRRI